LYLIFIFNLYIFICKYNLGKGNHDNIVAFIEEREKIAKENAEKAKEEEKQPLCNNNFCL